MCIHDDKEQAVLHPATFGCLLLVCLWLASFPSMPADTLSALQSPSTTQRGIALVIGNAAYQTGRLRNPGNDAADMAGSLRQLGFEITLVRDANLRQMEDAIDQFIRRLRRGGTGLFYFAGHGVQVAGENYLIPLGSRIDRPQDVRYEAVPAGRVLGAMEDAGNAVNIVILDACRNNPYAQGWRSANRGLAIVQGTRGSLIAYATAPGKVAADGEGRNGIYTKHLLQYMTAPGLLVERVFKKVRIAVMQETGGQQTPWVSTSITADFYFVPPPSPPPASVEPRTQVAVGIYPTPSSKSPRPKTLRNTIGMEFVLIPAGAFMMGANDGSANEQPIHMVRMSRPFYLGKYEVTQGQWQAVMRNNPSGFTGHADLPVEQISWQDVQAFIRRLNAREGSTAYRLPTEAEWEYAAHAGSSTIYSFGDGPSRLGEHAWYRDNAEKKTHPVGQLTPNAWGVYDMYGNVREWVQDWYSKRYPADTVTAPQGPSSGSNRVNRGCSWANRARFCRSATRSLARPDDRFDLLGFRLLKTVP